VTLVRSVGMPLPKPDAVTTSRVVDETRGLHKPAPKAPEKDAPAKAIPKFERDQPQKNISRPSKVLEDDTPPPPGAIPYGQGGAPSMPYTQFSMTGQTQGGLGFSGPGGGDFSGRFPWYVEAVRRRISGNWFQSAIDPGLRWAPRVVVTFQILPDGTVTNVQVLRSSGNSSVDLSARRAVLDSSPLERLPSGYGGSSVTVEFWFDFRR
jgi:TonB family protein